MEQYKALNSEYVIDGIRLDSSPAELLDECLREIAPKRLKTYEKAGEIADESLDREIKTTCYSQEKIISYCDSIENAEQPRPFELAYAEQFTRQRIAKALLDSLWKGGSFRLQDLSLSLDWKWDSEKLGAMAAFRLSAAAAADYIYEINSAIKTYSFKDGCDSCVLDVRVDGCGDERICPEIPQDGQEDDWLIYIPFDTCQFRLGASLLARAQGPNGDPAPEIGDPDWFIDCYEVLREMVEDGVIVGGATVCDGGLVSALKKCCKDADINVSGLARSYDENDTVRLLFGEVPGVLVRVRDLDYDYIDSQMILQDIAYYAIGRPAPEGTGLAITNHSKPPISRIIDSLLNVATEGED